VPVLRDNITPRTSLYRVPGWHDTIALKHLCAAWQIYVTILPVKRLYTVSMGYVTKMLWNVCVPCARFTWQYFPLNVSVPCARFTWHNCTKTSVCRVPDFCDCISPKTSLFLVPGFLDNISPKTLQYSVPGLRDTIALKRLFAVSQISATIMPLKRPCTVCQAFVTQLA